MAIKKYSKVKFTLRKELIIILAAIVVLAVATILFNLPNKEEKFLSKWSATGISENHTYTEAEFDDLKGILSSKGENELTFVFFATPEDTNSVTYFSTILSYAETYGVKEVYIVDSAFVLDGEREEGNDFDKELTAKEENFKDAEGNTIKLDSACNLWVFEGSTLLDSVDNYEKSTDQWNHALLGIFSWAKKSNE